MTARTVGNASVKREDVLCQRLVTCSQRAAVTRVSVVPFNMFYVSGISLHL